MDVSSIGRSLEADETSVESSRPDWWQSSEEDDWWTPQWLFDLVDAEIGFEIDVCASDANRKCVKYFTREHDGLAQEWTGKCWMNPPYGRSGGVSIYDWIEKAYASAKQGATVACLIPARTDTLWWWDFCIHGEIRFLKGRLRFENSNTIAPFPSAVVIFWPFVPVSKAKVIWWDVKDGHES
ncbi:MAG: DNA N-6-adenine-methyltransferase [Candidatus Hodarchaeota archaeon]